MNSVNRQDKEGEKSFFSHFSGGDYDVFTDNGYRRILSFFNKEIGVREDDKVLDLGCGSGAFTRYLSGLSAKVFALDISWDLMRKSSGKGEIRFVAADIEKLPFPDNSIDIVVFSGVLHHFQSLAGPAGEAYRVLKKGGRCFAFDPNNDNPVMWVFRNKKSPFYLSKGVTPNECLLAAGQIRPVFLDAGFSHVRVFAISGISCRYVYSRLARFFLPAYNFLDYILSRCPCAYRRGAFLLTISRK